MFTKLLRVALSREEKRRELSLLSEVSMYSLNFSQVHIVMERKQEKNKWLLENPHLSRQKGKKTKRKSYPKLHIPICKVRASRLAGKSGELLSQPFCREGKQLWPSQSELSGRLRTRKSLGQVTANQLATLKVFEKAKFKMQIIIHWSWKETNDFYDKS